jgi:hypothetical protein
VAGFPLAGSGLYTGPGSTIAALDGSPTFVAALFAGTSPSSLSLQTTTTIDDWYNEGSVVPVNVILAGLPAGTPAWFQVQVYDSRLTNAYSCGYAGVSPIFQATPQASVYSPIYFRSPSPVNSTWAPGTFPLVDMVQYGPGFYGGIQVPTCFCDYFGEFTPQPTNQTVVLGATATFYVGAVACPPPNYQWYFNGVSIAAGTSSSLQIANAQLTNAGTYWAVLSNRSWGPWGGGFTSSSATLTVLAAPVITSPPQSQTAFVGSTVDFQASAAGAPPLAYQWSFASIAESVGWRWVPSG